MEDDSFRIVLPPEEEIAEVVGAGVIVGASVPNV